MTRAHAGPPRGVLRPGPDALGTHLRLLPARALRPFVEHYWIVGWDLRGRPSTVAETLPHPSVHWVTERGRSTIRGVTTGRFTRRLSGKGRAFGVKFRPGGFYPFRRAPVSAFTDRMITLADAFGAEGVAIGRTLRALDARALQDDVEEAEVNEAMMAAVDAFLLARLPPPDPQLDLVTRSVRTIVETPEITKVDAVAARLSVSPRALQRVFQRYVGVSPKWVIQRYRLHEAVARVAAGEPVHWACLAADLGFFDQTHFIKAFKALVGQPPANYAQSLARLPAGGSR